MSQPWFVFACHGLACLAENGVLKWGGLGMEGFFLHIRFVVTFGPYMNLHGSGLSCMDLRNACSLVCLSLLCMKICLAFFSS